MRAVTFTLVFLSSILTSSCVNYRIVGGPKQIDRTVPSTAYLQEIGYLVKDSENAMFELRKLKRRQIIASTLTISCGVLVITGSMMSTLGTSEIPILASGIAISGLAVGLCITSIFIVPQKRDYAHIIHTYNNDKPRTPYWSDDLGVREPRRRRRKRRTRRRKKQYN